jgi:hypothetical protein
MFGLESLAFGLAAAGDHEAGAVLGKSDRGGATDACEGSSDQNDWLFHGVAPYRRIDGQSDAEATNGPPLARSSIRNLVGTLAESSAIAFENCRSLGDAMT